MHSTFYKARDDEDKMWVGLPADECQTCGAIQLDADRIARMTLRQRRLEQRRQGVRRGRCARCAWRHGFGSVAATGLRA